MFVAADAGFGVIQTARQPCRLPGLALIDNASDAITDPVAIVANMHVFEPRFGIVINGRALRLIGNVTFVNRKLEWSNQNCRVT